MPHNFCVGLRPTCLIKIELDCVLIENLVKSYGQELANAVAFIKRNEPKLKDSIMQDQDIDIIEENEINKPLQ